MGAFMVPNAWASLVTQMVKNLPAVQETQVQSLDWEDPLGKGIATYSSFLAWKIPWTEELAGYSPWGCKEPDMTERLSVCAHAHTECAHAHTLTYDQASLVARMVKNLPLMGETQVLSLGREDPLEKQIATHFSILAWKTPWTVT